MLFVIIFFIAMLLIAAFAFYLNARIETGEARFDSETGKLISDKKPEKPVEPARKIED